MKRAEVRSGFYECHRVVTEGVKMKKRYYVLFVLMISLLLTGFSCDKYAKAGQLAKDFAATVLVAQQLETQAYNGGYIQPATHTAIEARVSELPDAGGR